MNVLALNSGSSSLKFGVYRVTGSRTDLLVSGAAESIGESKAKFVAKDDQQNGLISEATAIPSQAEANWRGMSTSTARVFWACRHT